jgi:hypothetical protein
MIFIEERVLLIENRVFKTKKKRVIKFLQLYNSLIFKPYKSV